MNREAQIHTMANSAQWDIIIIGGGATGLGSALDAASRGYKTLCIERFDFSKGTSSRSTKLIHGGVRYLEQGNIKLVRGALLERSFLLNNAPEMTKAIPFILPVYSWFKFLYYGIGLKIYDLLSGKLSIGKTQFLSSKEVIKHIPEVNSHGLKGGILYFDGQFDDSEICMSLVRTAIQYGATVVNYCVSTGFIYENGAVAGIIVQDHLSGNVYRLQTKVVINATGVFADEVLRIDNPNHKNVVSPSRGIHIVVSKSFYSGQHALLIPKTTDGRVLFVVPWHDKVVIGTTDSKIKDPVIEPVAASQELDFVMNNFNQYTSKNITKNDFLSVFAGLRPLVKMSNIKSTANLLRDHAIYCSDSGLITITGGKWTTYRKMAKDVINKAIMQGGFPFRKCITRTIRLIQKPIILSNTLDDIKLLHPHYPFTVQDVKNAIHQEMAMTLEDVLARRIRLLFLDVKAALFCAEIVADILQHELGKDNTWKEEQLQTFRTLAKQYLPET